MNKNKWISITAFANIYIIWGLTFIAISFGLEGFPPFILSGFRFFIAGALIISYLFVKGERATSITYWKRNAVTGILVLAGGTGLVGWGEQYVSAPEAAIAIATGPFWFIAIDKKNWRTYFADKWILIGLVIGFSGLVLFLGGSIPVAHGSQEKSQATRVIAFIALALSSISWVLGSLHSKKNPAGHSTFMNIAQQLIIGGIASFIIASCKGEWNEFPASPIPFSAWSGLIFLIVFGSIIAYLSYIWLLSVKPAPLVSTHTYINPIVTVLSGWIISNEIVNTRQMTSLFIILAGVLLTNVSKYFRLTKRSKVKIRHAVRLVTNVRQAHKHIAPK